MWVPWAEIITNVRAGWACWITTDGAFVDPKESEYNFDNFPLCGNSSKAQTRPSTVNKDCPSINIFWNGKRSPERSHRRSVDSFWADANSKVPENLEKKINCNMEKLVQKQTILNYHFCSNSYGLWMVSRQAMRQQIRGVVLHVQGLSHLVLDWQCCYR